MPNLIFSNLSFSLPNGTELFSNLSASLRPGVTALVGRNGSGKSCLAAILAGELAQSSGQVQRPRSLIIFHQQDSDLFNASLNIAEFIEVQHKLDALERVAIGEYLESDFDTIAGDWGLQQHCDAMLKALNITHALSDPCKTLSGGERVKLKLWRCFYLKSDCLILDEPSNHLDFSARIWLAEQIRQYKGSLLLISHDKQLLELATSIWSLSSLGLREFSGSYDDFIIDQKRQVEAIDKSLASNKAEEKRLHKLAEIAEQKAAQRERQGKALRGSQAKSLLDGKKECAESTARGRIKQRNNQIQRVQHEISELAAQKEQLKPQYFKLKHGSKVKKLIRRLEQAQLPFGCQSIFNLSIYAGDTLYLKGKNGSGKSTFLKMLMGEISPKAGTVYGSVPLVYLDQHYSLINQNLSLLENLQAGCPGQTETQYRTLLSGIGFRRERVMLQCSELSGGEKMKLAMLMVSHRPRVSFLLLDEPDNHLDMESKELLINALRNYGRGFCLVSHDMWFVKCVGVDKILEF